MTESLDHDLAVLAGSRPWRRFAMGDEVLDSEETPRDILFLTAGGAVLAAETHFGPHPVATLNAPALLNLKTAINGSPNLYRMQFVDEKSEAIVFTPEEASHLLFDTSEEGQAFRRIALSSVTFALRDTNLSLARFFDELSANAKKTQAVRDSGQFQAVGQSVALDPEKVYDLFDAAGLNPSGLPDLGLVARRLPAEGILMKAGTKGDEAYLLAEGRLRVYIRIPGVGEEALAILSVGEIVGEMALIDDAARSADVCAHEKEALVYVLSRNVFQKLLRSGDPAGAPLLAGITVALTRRLEEAIRKSAGFRVLAGPF